MNIKVGEKKFNSFSVGNPASGLGDAIVGTYGPGGRGQCEQIQDPGNETITITEPTMDDILKRIADEAVVDWVTKPGNPFESKFGW